MAKTTSVTDLLGIGMKAAALRGQVIANNIANLETPGYRRKDVRFEQLLAKALTSSGRIDLAKLQMEVIEPRSTAVNAQGNDVNLDQEIGEMVRNSATYKVYVRLLDKLYRQMELAIAGE